MAETALIQNVTIPNYIRGFEDATKRGRVILAMLEKKGHYHYNEGGISLDWPAQTTEPDVSPYTDGGTIVYTAHDGFKRASLPFRSVKASGMITDWTKEVNKGNAALVKLKAEIIDQILGSLRNQLGKMLYCDGNATGQERSIHGMNTMFGTVGTTVAADIVGKPAATYAGISTAVGVADTYWATSYTTYPNADIATNWPDPEGSSGYDHWSPRWANYSSTNWGTGSTAWEDNCSRVIRFGILSTRVSNGEEGKVDVVLMSPNLYRGYLNRMEPRLRVVQPASKLLEMGFSGVQQEGVEITDDFDCPVNSGFGINFDLLHFHSLKSGIFHMDPAERDPKTDSMLYLGKIFATMRSSTPKGHFKFSAIA